MERLQHSSDLNWILRIPSRISEPFLHARGPALKPHRRLVKNFVDEIRAHRRETVANTDCAVATVFGNRGAYGTMGVRTESS